MCPARLLPYRTTLAAVAILLTTPALARPVYFDSFTGARDGASVNATNPEIGGETYTRMGNGTAVVRAASPSADGQLDVSGLPAATSLLKYGPDLAGERWQRFDFASAERSYVAIVPQVQTGKEENALALPALMPAGPPANPWAQARCCMGLAEGVGTASPAVLDLAAAYPAWDRAKPFHLEVRWVRRASNRAELGVRVWNGDTAPAESAACRATYTLNTGAFSTWGRAAVGGSGAAALVTAMAEDTAAPVYPSLLPATDAGISWSGRWVTVNGTERHASSAGQSFRFLVTGDTCTLRVRGAGFEAKGPELACRIDGGAWTRLPALPAADAEVRLLAEGGTWGPHLIEVSVVTAWPYDTWAGTASRFMLKGISLAPGGAVSPVPYPARKVVFLGDSIMVGHYVLPSPVDASEGGQGDATKSMPSLLAATLGFEAVNVSQPSIGFLAPHGAKTALPFLRETIQGVPWTPDFRPAAVVINLGTNDWNTVAYPDADLAEAVRAYLLAVRQMFPSSPVRMLRPLNGARQAALRAGFDAAGLGNAAWVDTAGWLDLAYNHDTTDAVHPSIAGNLRYAERMEALLAPLVAAPTGDVDGDGMVTVADAALVLGASGGLSRPDPGSNPSPIRPAAVD